MSTNRYVGKVENLQSFDEDGNGCLAYAVNSAGFQREAQINVVGTREEIFSLLSGILGANAAPTPAPVATAQESTQSGGIDGAG